MPARFIHDPWDGARRRAARRGRVLGETYPRPVVDHRYARERFLTLASQHLSNEAASGGKPGRTDRRQAQRSPTG